MTDSRAPRSNRRRFLSTAATGLAAGGIAGCVKHETAPGAVTSPRLRWRLASSFPRSLDTIFGAADTLAEQLKALTDGRFEIDVYPAGELVPGLQVLDGVQNANCEVGHSASYYYIGKNPALAFDTSIPFGLTARQQAAWLTEEGGGLPLMRKLFSDYNIVNFPGGNTGVQMGGWFRNPIGSLADLRGIKMRIPGLGGKIMNEMGVTVQVLGADIYPALERGAIDATEWVGPYDDMKLGFHQVAKHYYYPGWWEPGPGLSFYVNQNAWNKLPAAYQAAFTAAAGIASQGMMTRYDVKNPPALQAVKDAGVQLHAYPVDVMDKASEIMEAMAADLAAEDAGYATILQQWSAFRAESFAWFNTAEQAYATAAFLKA